MSSPLSFSYRINMLFGGAVRELMGGIWSERGSSLEPKIHATLECISNGQVLFDFSCAAH